jgi:hypothetical protein
MAIVVTTYPTTNATISNAIGLSGNIWTSDVNGLVIIQSLAYTQTVPFINMNRIAVDVNNNLVYAIASASYNCVIKQLNSAGTVLNTWSIGNIQIIQDSVVDSSGNLWISVGTGLSFPYLGIYSVSPTGTPTQYAVNANMGFMCCDGTNIYVINTSTGKVMKCIPGTGISNFCSPSGSLPALESMAWDSDLNRLWVFDPVGKSMQVFDVSGNPITNFAVSTGTSGTGQGNALAYDTLRKCMWLGSKGGTSLFQIPTSNYTPVAYTLPNGTIYLNFDSVSGNVLIADATTNIVTAYLPYKPPTVGSTVNASSVTSKTAKSGGIVTSEGDAPVTAYGVVWDTSPNPTIVLSTKTVDGSGSGSFVSSLTNLFPNTLYYVRDYATNANGTTYGTQITFTTSAAVQPTVVTNPVSNILSTSALAGGNVTNAGDGAVTIKGVCWNTTGSPTPFTDSFTNDGSGLGNYASTLSPLLANTVYHYRAYATSIYGTTYGTEYTFTSGVLLPVVTTTAISNVTHSSAQSGGNVTVQGDTPVIAAGIVWNLVGSPTLSDNFTVDSSGLGAFVSQLLSLTQGMTVYVRAYATNGGGTSYGNQVSSTVLSYVRTNKIIRRVADNLKDIDMRNHHFDTLLDRLNLVQEELCRDFFAYKGTVTFSIVSGQAVYTLDPTIYKIKQIYTPSGWHEPITVITDPQQWNELSCYHTRALFVYLWNGVLTFSKAPTASITTTMDVYLLPSTPILRNTDPAIDSQWDLALEYGLTSVYDSNYLLKYRAEAQTRMEQNLKESIQGTQFVDSDQRDIWSGGHRRSGWHLA